jgi:hypothetical protein
MNIIESISSGLSATVPMWLYLGVLTILTINNLVLRFQIRKLSKHR